MAKESECFSSQKLRLFMRKIVYILNSVELMDRLFDSKRVEGALFIDKSTGMITFKAYNRASRRRPKDRVIVELEHGWLRESSRRYKFFSSVKKELGAVQVAAAMKRELERATSAMYLDEIMED